MPFDLIWAWYLTTVSIAVAAAAPSCPEGRPWAFVAVQLGMLVGLGVMRLSVRDRGALAQRVARGAYAVLAIWPVFMSMAWVLPAVNPEPWEWTWIDLDRALLGADPTIAVQAALAPWFTELLQWCYAVFYLLPLVAVLGIARYSGGAGFDRALAIVSFCFLLSYLGYFLWPTLPPYRYLHHEVPIEGVWLTTEIHEMLDEAELHKWNCFPSGHTMLSAVSVAICWRGARPVFWGLLPVAALLIFSTVALRYHYVSDVLAGLLLTPVGIWLGGVVAGGRAAAVAPAPAITAGRSVHRPAR